MPIEFHCEKCGKSVRAPDEAAGKHGKCPTCHQSVYIPSIDVEPLELAPLDEASEQADKQARAAAMKLAGQLETDNAPRGGGGADTPPRVGGQIAEPRMPMDQLVVAYAKAMAAGELNEAEQYANDIRRDKNKAKEAIQTLMSDEILPDALANVPRPVLVGFFKQL